MQGRIDQSVGRRGLLSPLARLGLRLPNRSGFLKPDQIGQTAGDILRQCGHLAGDSFRPRMSERSILAGDDVSKANQQPIVANRECRNQDIPFVNLDKYNLTPDVIKLVPREFVNRYRVVPVDKFRDILTLATADPDNIDEVAQKLSAITGMKVEVLLTTTSQLNRVITRYFQ